MAINNLFFGTSSNYLENDNPDTSAEDNYVVDGDMLIISLHYAGPDQVSPMESDSARTKNDSLN
jgi:hypothetical protein